MRLTLRTLLAWMDDTLPPSRVREIGNQVTESPFAQELVERIRRVSRQRRLTVPRSSGPESIDPNLEAGYLDNDLDSEQVAEVEKQCLNQDVCLAEVASVHQILSLLGQRAKVPREVKERMYQLVKGREAIPMRHREPTERSRPLSVVNPVQPWIDRESASRSRRERYALLAGCLACFVVLGTSAWYSLSSAPSGPLHGSSLPAEVVAVTDPSLPDKKLDPTDAIAFADGDPLNPIDPSIPKDATEAPPTPAVTASTKTPKATEAPKVPAPAESPAPAPSALPPGAVGKTEKGDNVLLRYSDEKREWERLADATILNPSDRLACLAPFRASLDLASAGLTMLEGSEARLPAPATAGQSRFEARKGRFKATKTPRGTTIVLDLGAKESVTLDLAGTTSLAIERLSRRAYGQPTNLPASWAIYCQDGILNVSQGDTKKAFDAPAVITVNEAGTIEHRAGESPPLWVVETEPAPADREIRDQFLRSFHTGRPILAEIVTATEDSQDSIRRLAISALTTLGDLSYVMPLLDRKDAPAIRRDAIAALRDFLSLGAEATQQAREQIQDVFGETNGPLVEKMLIGYTPAEAAEPGTLRKLIDQLDPGTPSVGIRELSLDNLCKLTGRDSLGYNADQPEGEGLANWKKLLNEGKLLPNSEEATQK